MEWNKDTVKMFRKKLSLTQHKFAELLGTSQEHISRWENGKRNLSGISQKFLTFLAEKEGVNLEELLEENFEKS